MMAKVPLVSALLKAEVGEGFLIEPWPPDGSDPSQWERWIPRTPEEWDEAVEDLVELWNGKRFTIQEVLRDLGMEWPPKD